jgi:hypothetical protein
MNGLTTADGKSRADGRTHARTRLNNEEMDANLPIPRMQIALPRG